jgi:hypothetical protein
LVEIDRARTADQQLATKTFGHRVNLVGAPDRVLVRTVPTSALAAIVAISEKTGGEHREPRDRISIGRRSGQHCLVVRSLDVRSMSFRRRETTGERRCETVRSQAPGSRHLSIVGIRRTACQFGHLSSSAGHLDPASLRTIVTAVYRRWGSLEFHGPDRRRT